MSHSNTQQSRKRNTKYEIRNIAIVGGGITGLAAAYELQRSGVPYTLIEESSQVGGKIITGRENGFVVEGGPDSFLTQKPWAVELCRELELGDRLMPTNNDQREVFILNDGELVPLPEGVMLVVPTKFLPFVTTPLISWPGKIRMGLDLFIPPREETSDESLGNFIRRRLGQEALDKIAEPLMAGIHNADPNELSLRASFPRFARIEQTYGSLIRGMIAARARRRTARRNGDSKRPSSQFLTLRGGIGELVDALLDALDDEALITGRRATRIEKKPAGYTVYLDNSQSIDADAVILATPAHASADLVADFNPELAADLRQIRYVSTATVSLGYRRNQIQHPLNGFGFLVPATERRRISACTWVTTKFDHRAPSDHVLLRVFGGGAGQEHFVDLGDEAMLQVVREELHDIMSITAEPMLTHIYRWPAGRPQYEVGHLERVEALEAQTNTGLFLAGSAYHGAGLPDCIRSGRDTARQARSLLEAPIA